jgi:dUTP pyrophosphatase
MFVRLNKFREGPVMKHAHIEDAGWDVYSKEGVILNARETRVVPLGFGIELPRGAAGFIMPRTSMSKRGVVVHSCPVDSGYLGEIHAILTNTTDELVDIAPDVAVAQLVILNIAEPAWTYGPCNHMWDNNKDKAFIKGANKPRLAGAFGSTNDKKLIAAILAEDGCVAMEAIDAEA